MKQERCVKPNCTGDAHDPLHYPPERCPIERPCRWPITHHDFTTGKPFEEKKDEAPK